MLCSPLAATKLLIQHKTLQTQQLTLLQTLALLLPMPALPLLTQRVRLQLAQWMQQLVQLTQPPLVQWMQPVLQQTPLPPQQTLLALLLVPLLMLLARPQLVQLTPLLTLRKLL